MCHKIFVICEVLIVQQCLEVDGKNKISLTVIFLFCFVTFDEFSWNNQFISIEMIL